MKLLSWMHRKLQKDNTGSFKGSAVANSCPPLKPRLKNQNDYARPGSNTKLKCEHFLDEFKAEDMININKEESGEIFPGFLTIGTLSVEPVTEPPTPTFDLPHQKANEDGTAEIKYDLKLITEELEKFLTGEFEKEGNNEPLGMNSQASDLTFIGKEEEVDDCKCIDLEEYPLQGYLLASSNELRVVERKERKESVSLQELFQNSTITDKSLPEETEQKAEKKPKSSTYVINKMLQTLQPSLKNSTAYTGYAVEFFPPMTKLSKNLGDVSSVQQFLVVFLLDFIEIKWLFHKKIHPAISTAEKHRSNFGKNETNKIVKSPSHSCAASAHDYESTRMGCWGNLLRGKNHWSKADTQLPQHASTKRKVNTEPNDNNSSVSKEHWINTDAEYLVLELQQNREAPY